MLRSLLVLALAGAAVSAAPRPAPPAAPVAPPTLAEVRATMGIPSRAHDLRGQRDTVGYASRAGQMDAVWTRAAAAPAPESLGPAPAPGVAALLAPHDDHVYSARVQVRTLPLVTARTVVLIGPLHGYARFGVRDRLVFEPYRAWAAADGPVPVSPLRLETIARLPEDDVTIAPEMHDAEHSLEGLVIALRHQRPDLEIVPILVPAASLERLRVLADHLGAALGDVMRDRGLVLGRDVAVVLSTDGVHYGEDFHHTPFGPGGAGALRKAIARDRGVLTGPLAGRVTDARIASLYATFVDPAAPDTYRLTWCGRFAVPFGLLVLDRMALAEGRHLTGHPLAYTTSASAPPLALRDLGLGATAPASPAHFVGLPAAAFTLEGARER